MTEKVQINLRAGAEQKARWETYIEESGRFATLSELIRASVEAEISQSETDAQAPNPALAGDVQRYDAFLDRLVEADFADDRRALQSALD